MVEEYDAFNDRAYFKYAFTWKPRKCYVTGKWIVGGHVMGVRLITGPGDTIVETRWYHRDQGILLLLKKGN